MNDYTDDTVTINDLAIMMQNEFRAIHKRIDGIEARLDRVEQRLDDIEKDIKIIKSVIIIHTDQIDSVGKRIFALENKPA